MTIYDPDLYAVIKIRKIDWVFGPFVASNLTVFEANRLCKLHNRWWKWYHFDCVPPVVLRGLENEYLTNQSK